jgi:Na+-transporting NADH:ubiquinone oxidoreductase subunit F
MPSYKIDINCGAKVIEAFEEEFLIDVLAKNAIYLPSACGSSGKCGLCKVTVLNDDGPLTDSEKRLLSKNELSEKMRLSCQVKIRSDLLIKIPSEYLGAKEFAAQLREKALLTSDIIELTLDIVSPESITFTPGQYITLKCPVYDDKKMVMRPFSIASSSSQKSSIQLNVRLNRSGTCTPWIFDHLQNGQEVHFSGPRGNFHLQNTLRPILFIAGGSGMAPVRSILKTMAENSIDRKVLFFFGALTEGDLFYIDEMAELEKQMEDFRFIPALSNEPSQSSWDGERGLITDVLSRFTGADLSECEAYLCGKPAMIEDCLPVLESKGIPRERTFFDLFSPAKILQR